MLNNEGFYLTYAVAIKKVEAAVSKEIKRFEARNIQSLVELDLSKFA